MKNLGIINRKRYPELYLTLSEALASFRKRFKESSISCAPEYKVDTLEGSEAWFDDKGDCHFALNLVLVIPKYQKK